MQWYVPPRPSFLLLATRSDKATIIPRDVRRLIYAYLVDFDREMIRCAHNRHRVWTVPADFINYCAKRGYLEMLKWARASGAPWDIWTCAEAALGGHLELLQWARANGASWGADGEVSKCAAENGHLAVLQWALANGASWNKSTCQIAAGCGRLELLQWAYENGAFLPRRLCVLAAKNGDHHEVLQWLQDLP